VNGGSNSETTISAKVPLALARKLREVAAVNDRTLSGQLRRVLRDWAAGQPQQGA
jgi:hypothetical protein